MRSGVYATVGCPSVRLSVPSIAQARRREMKCGGVVKKGKMGGVFFVKKWTFPQHKVHYVQYQYFYFTFYLFGGAYAPNAPPAGGPVAAAF